MPAAIQPRRTRGRHEVLLGAASAIALHLLAAWLLLRPAPAAPPEMPRILQVSLISAPLQAQPPAPQPPAPTATPPTPKPPQPQRRPAPKPAVVKHTVRNPEPVEPVPPVRPIQSVPPAIASTTSAAPPTTPTTAAPAPIETVTEPRFDAAYLNNPTPPYPALSRRLREQGRVLMRVYVDPQGAPAQVQLRQSSGHPRLDSAAEAAVRRWRFVPARQGSDAIGAWVLVPISFSLRS